MKLYKILLKKWSKKVCAIYIKRDTAKQTYKFKGTAEWEGGPKGSKTEAYLYWHTPEEWANLIWNWVMTT